MELTNEFYVPVPLERAWAVLTDVERIAPCMPGAQLEEVEGSEYRGGVKIKVGPITAQYKGKASFIEKDDVNHKAVLKAEGRDTKGQGNASATVTAVLVSVGNGTNVTVTTDLTVTGKVAQFGRGVMADVSKKLLEQFVHCLEHDVLSTPEETVAAVAKESASVSEATAGSGGAAGTSGGASAPASGSAAPLGEPERPTVRKIDYKPAAPVNILETAGAPVIKRAAPIAAIVFLLVWLLRRRKK